MATPGLSKLNNRSVIGRPNPTKVEVRDKLGNTKIQSITVSANRSSIFGSRFTPVRHYTSNGWGISAMQQYPVYSNASYQPPVNTSGAWLGFAMSMIPAASGLFTQLFSMFRPSGGSTSVTPDSATSSYDASSLTGQVWSAKDFNTLNATEQTINTQKSNLKGDYSKLDKSSAITEKIGDTDVKTGFELAGVTLDANDIKLSDIQGGDNFDADLKTIEGDINKVTNFKTTTLPKAKASITEKKGIISGQINSKQINLDKLIAQRGKVDAPGDLETQISTLENEIKELKTQEEQLKKAEAAIDEMVSICDENLQSLKSKQNEIKDLQKADNAIKDKQYQLAKSQDEQIDKVKKQIDKLTNEINKLEDKNAGKADSSDNRRLAKYNKLINNREALYTEFNNLKTSLNQAPAEIKNSKGQAYEIKNKNIELTN